MYGANFNSSPELGLAGKNWITEFKRPLKIRRGHQSTHRHTDRQMYGADFNSSSKLGLAG